MQTSGKSQLSYKYIYNFCVIKVDLSNSVILKIYSKFHLMPNFKSLISEND